MRNPAPTPKKLLKVGAQVMTPLGNGTVRFVYPLGPHHKFTYAVAVDGLRINRIFDEKQLQLLEASSVTGLSKYVSDPRNPGIQF